MRHMLQQLQQAGAVGDQLCRKPRRREGHGFTYGYHLGICTQVPHAASHPLCSNPTSPHANHLFSVRSNSITLVYPTKTNAPSKQIILKLHPLANRQHDRRLRPDPIHRRLQMRLAPQLEIVALRVPSPPAPGDGDVVLRPRRALAPGPLGFRQAVEGAVAVGALAQRAGAVARGGGVRAMGATPDDEDEEGAQGGEAGGYDGDGGLGGGPDGDGDVVPWVWMSVFEREGL